MRVTNDWILWLFSLVILNSIHLGLLVLVYRYPIIEVLLGRCSKQLLTWKNGFEDILVEIILLAVFAS